MGAVKLGGQGLALAVGSALAYLLEHGRHSLDLFTLKRSPAVGREGNGRGEEGQGFLRRLDGIQERARLSVRPARHIGRSVLAIAGRILVDGGNRGVQVPAHALEVGGRAANVIRELAGILTAVVLLIGDEEIIAEDGIGQQPQLDPGT